MDIIIPYFFIYSFKVRKKRSFFLVDFVCVCVCRRWKLKLCTIKLFAGQLTSEILDAFSLPKPYLPYSFLIANQSRA